MSVLLLVGKLVPAGVFAFAGAMKLLDGTGSRAAFAGFGVPAPLVFLVRTPDGHCHGQLHSAPVGSRTLARNAAQMALAAGPAGGRACTRT